MTHETSIANSDRVDGRDEGWGSGWDRYFGESASVVRRDRESCILMMEKSKLRNSKCNL